MNLETQRSNFSVMITTNFTINADDQYITLAFSEPTVIPSDISLFINGNLMSVFFDDEFIVGSLPIINAGQQFRLDLSNFLNPPPASNKICYISIYTRKQDEIPTIAQNTFSMISSESFEDTTFFLTFIDSIDAVYNTYSQIQLNMQVHLEDVIVNQNDIFRIILPTDFPPNYYYDSQLISCLITIVDLDKTMPFSCQMKGTNIDIIISSNLGITDFTYVTFILQINNVLSSVNYGLSGDFGFAVLNSSIYTKGLNFQAYDSYENPTLIQNLLQVIKTGSVANTNSLDSISISRGSISTIYLRTLDIVIIQ